MNYIIEIQPNNYDLSIQNSLEFDSRPKQTNPQFFQEESENINGERQQRFDDFIGDPQYRPRDRHSKNQQQDSQKVSINQNVALSSNPILLGQLQTQQAIKENKQDQFISKDHQAQTNSIKSAPYPTKNFLQAFKIIFFNEIKATLGQQWEQIPHLKKINDKNGINLKQFLQVLKTPILRQHFSQYFRSKKIMRDLMMSRVKFQQKIIYFSRVHRFEQAFVTGRFDHIN